MKIKLYLLYELFSYFNPKSFCQIGMKYFHERISSREMSSSISGVPAGQGVEGERGERRPDLLAHPRRPGGRQQEPELPPVVRQLDGVGDLGAGPAAPQHSCPCPRAVCALTWRTSSRRWRRPPRSRCPPRRPPRTRGPAPARADTQPEHGCSGIYGGIIHAAAWSDLLEGRPGGLHQLVHAGHRLGLEAPGCEPGLAVGVQGDVVEEAGVEAGPQPRHGRGLGLGQRARALVHLHTAAAASSVWRPHLLARVGGGSQPVAEVVVPVEVHTPALGAGGRGPPVLPPEPDHNKYV